MNSTRANRPSVRRGARFNRLLSASAALVLLLASCGSDASASKGESLSHYVLIDGVAAGEPWTTAMATDQRSLRQMWLDHDLPMPVGAVDFSANVAVYFGSAEASDCPIGSVVDVRFDSDTARLYPVFEYPDGRSGCGDDANPHAAVVTIPIGELPDTAFEIWVANAEPPACCPDNATAVPASAER